MFDHRCLLKIKSSYKTGNTVNNTVITMYSAEVY